MPWKIEQKKYWRCNICNDIHFGFKPLATCPTCMAKNAYCQIDKKEAMNLFGSSSDESMNPEQIKGAWQKFAEDNDFVLNPDEKHVEMVLNGILENEKKHGLKLCPCRLRDGTRQKDLELICPCNFKTQETWNKRKDCWCGLFVRRENGS